VCVCVYVCVRERERVCERERERERESERECVFLQMLYYGIENLSFVLLCNLKLKTISKVQ